MSPVRWLLATLSFVAVVVVAAFVIARHWPEGGAMLGLPLWAHGVLLGTVTVELTLRGLKISLAARSCGIALQPGTAVRATLCGDFLDAIAPARVGAEPARFLVLREAGVSIAHALLVLFLELLLELLSLVAIAAVLIVLLPWSRAMGALTGMVALYGSFVLVIAVIGYLGARPGRTASAEPAGSATFVDRLRLRLLHTAHHLRAGVVALRQARLGVLALAFLCSIGHVLARLTILPIILVATGASVPLAPIVLWPLVLLYAGALAPAPSGGGVMEFGFSAALGSTIPADVIAAALIWWRLYSFFIYVALGALAAGRTAMRALDMRSEIGVRRPE